MLESSTLQERPYRGFRLESGKDPPPAYWPCVWPASPKRPTVHAKAERWQDWAWVNTNYSSIDQIVGLALGALM